MSGYLDTGPATSVSSVTPSDTTPLTNIARAVWIGVAGDVSVVMADDTTATIVGVPAGTLLPLRAKRINSTNTTASSIVALY